MFTSDITSAEESIAARISSIAEAATGIKPFRIRTCEYQINFNEAKGCD